MAMLTKLDQALQGFGNTIEGRNLLKRTAPNKIPPKVVAAIMRRLNYVKLECHEEQVAGDLYARAHFLFEDAEYCNRVIFRYGALDRDDLKASINHVVTTLIYLEPHIWLGLAVAYQDEAVERDRHSDNAQPVLHK